VTEETPLTPNRRCGRWLPALGVFLVMWAALWWSDQRAINDRRWILNAVQRQFVLRSHRQKVLAGLPDLPFLDVLLTKEVLYIDLYDDADVDRLLSIPAPDPALCLFVGSAVTAERRQQLERRFCGSEINDYEF